MSILEVELGPETTQRLHQAATKSGLPPADIVRAAVENLLEAEDGNQPLHSVMEFHGAGREALKDLDVDQYIREMRDEWDR